MRIIARQYLSDFELTVTIDWLAYLPNWCIINIEAATVAH
jgi:hypothetical protein